MSEVVTSLRHLDPHVDQVAQLPILPSPLVPDLEALHLKVESLQRQVELQHDSLIKILAAFRTETYSSLVSLRSGNQPEDFRYYLRNLPDARLAPAEARAR
jgi:hypothetical protein